MVPIDLMAIEIENHSISITDIHYKSRSMIKTINCEDFLIHLNLRVRIRKMIHSSMYPIIHCFIIPLLRNRISIKPQ